MHQNKRQRKIKTVHDSFLSPQSCSTCTTSPVPTLQGHLDRSNTVTKGNIVHLDTNADNAVVYPNGSSNSSLQLNVPAAFDVIFIGLDSTNYQVYGHVTSTTAPAFADQ